MSPKEFRETVLIRNLKKPFESQEDKYFPLLNIEELPESFDWRDHDAVTPIKDQGMVGTCWAFSAVSLIEIFLI